MGREVRQGKMKYLQISCCRVPSQPGNTQHQNFLTSFLGPAVSAFGLDLPPPHSCSRLLVIIAGWHNQLHFTLLPSMQHHRPPPHPLPTTILPGTGVGLEVLGMESTWFAKNQRSGKRLTLGLGEETSSVRRLGKTVWLFFPVQRDQGEDGL